MPRRVRRHSPGPLSRALVALTALWFAGGTGSANAQGGPVTFSATGDIPYSDADADLLQLFVADHNALSPAEFLVHVGDIKAQSGECPEFDFARTFDILTGLAVPTFVLPGDNEWNDCSDPDAAWTLWETWLGGFEQNFCGTPLVEAQDVRPENFAFVRNRVLFLGLNLVGGSVHDSAEWALRMQQDADWVEQQFTEKGGQVRAAVVFAHAARNGSRTDFFERFDLAAQAFARPILYIHGDGHSWVYESAWGVPNVWRIQIDQNDPPLEVTVGLDPNDPFVFERDPWPPGTSPLNRPPCVEVGQDRIVAPGEDVPLDGFVSDDGVPIAPGLATAWTQASGPAPAIVSDPGSVATNASFSEPGRYVLRLTADDGELVGGDDLAIFVDSGQPFFWIRDASVVEGSTGTTSAEFTVDLLAGTGEPVSVDYDTADDTATAGEDYQAVSGSLLFSGATTSQVIAVPVLGDTTLEEPETFLVLLHDPVGAVIADGAASGLVLDDDVPRPPVVTSFAPASGPRGSVVVLTGQLSAVSGVSVGGVPADFTQLSDTQIELVVPATAHSGPIAATNPGGTAQSSDDFGIEFPLVLDLVGSGSLALDPPGGTYLEGATVTLTPQPASGWEFFQWSGDVGGDDVPAAIQITDGASVTAVFIEEGSALRIPHSVGLGSGSDDAEEAANGGVDLGSGDLELAVDGADTQVVGIRFPGLEVGRGATILFASVQFTADETSSAPVALTLWGEAVDHAAPFSNAPGDVSGRARTSASVPWNPPAWTGRGDAQAAQRSPDLSPILQEIVDRPGWLPGNAVVLTLTGTGTRTAESYEGSPSQAARLEVTEVVDLAPPEAPDGLRAAEQNLNSLVLEWEPAYDNLGVAGYRLYRESGPVDLTDTRFTEVGLAPDTEYAFQVSAFDAAGLESMPSPVLVARTLAPDDEAPTTPQNLRSPDQTETSIELAWDASTDDVGVTGYRVYRQSGPADVPGTSFTETGLTPGRSYAFQVSALDAAGNESLPGPMLVVRAGRPDLQPPAAPGNLRSPDQTETSIELAWDTSSDDVGVAGYRLYCPSGAVYLAGTHHVENGLEPDTEYAFQVAALDVAGNESPPSAVLKAQTRPLDREAPTTPQNLRSPDQTEISIELAWDAASDDVEVSAYRLYRPAGPVELTGTSHVETGLEPDTEYAFQVAALDAAGHESPPSPVLTARTRSLDRQPPTPPQNLRSPDQTETTLELAWDPSLDDVGVTGYRLYRPGGPFDVAGTSHLETGLEPDTEYAFQVAALDAAGHESAASAVLRVSTRARDRQAPTTPQNLRSPEQTETTIQLAWNASIDDVGVTGYRLYRPGGTLDVAGTSHVETGLEPDTSYAFQVAALDAAGHESAPSPVLTARTRSLDRQPPTPPKNLRSPVQSETRIDLAWDPSSDDVGVTGYRLYAPGGPVEISGTTHALDGLTPDTAYAFQVSALDAAGHESLPSAVLEVRTRGLDRLPPTTPQNLRSTARTQTRIDLAWDPSSDDVGVAGYRLYRHSGAIDLAGTSYSETGLVPGRAYGFQVSAFDAAGNESLPSPMLGVSTASPDVEPPSTPQNLRSPAQTETTVSLAWDASTDDYGVTGYRLYGPGGPVDVAGTSYVATGLAPDTEYAFQVSARDAAGNESPPSPVLSVRTQPPDLPPSTPQNLRSPAQTETTISLAWDASTDDVGVTGYRLYGPGSPIVVPGTTHTWTGLAADTEYAFQVSALDTGGHESDPSPVLQVRTLAPDVEPPSIPQNLRSPAQTGTTISLAWDAATDDRGVAGYRVYGPSGPVDVAGTTYTETGLAPLSEYDFQVSALDAAANESPLSPVLRVATLGQITISVRVAGSGDDVEEDLGNGNINVTSSDLELGGTANASQAVGLRFTGIEIPQGAPIVSASLQFTVDETSAGAAALSIRGEAADDAPPFSGTDGDVSGRPATSTSVPWSPPDWAAVGEAGAAQRTPDLAALVQEIVGRPGWSYGNALVLVVTGTGTRTAEAWDGVAGSAPLLEIEYLGEPDTEPPSTPGNLRSPSQTARRIELAWDAATDDRGVAGYRIYGPSGPVDVAGTAYTETGLAPLSEYDFQVSALDAAGNESPLSPILSVATNDVESLTLQVAVSGDDVEEDLGSGGINVTSSDLELGVSGSASQAVGLRFTGLAIPQGASIVSATLQFTADETGAGAAALSIRGEAADDAPPFSGTGGEVSGRPATSASVPWSPPDWTAVGAAGAAQRTPDLAALVQEIVDRPGWSSGNALVLVVTGTGTRTAESWDGVAGAAALLQVEYRVTGP